MASVYLVSGVGVQAKQHLDLLQAIAGLVPIAAGTISLRDWTASPSHEVLTEKRNIGMVFQDFALFPHLSVEQNVCFRLDDPARAEHWLEVLGLMTLRAASPARARPLRFLRPLPPGLGLVALLYMLRQVLVEAQAPPLGSFPFTRLVFILSPGVFAAAMSRLQPKHTSQT